ncbi:hypothetical protein GQ43DRAFT_441830 [Delitschia confertaspora ATCC 74209]|uniref:Actin cytoskeleton-regulatory complex protein SLA1 n=1 Tax=Delitschia confertaspora ATCC 74209 TaxID=1513339 RepID=A0A9P4MXS5_9PLEO|nr:hypothetical protein GQ43DRAFT_441830 [Delitschia confertaspora ATCC 74209]
MVFLGIYRAIYDYAPQSDNELTLKEGDILMVLERPADDDWWKAKKKVSSEDEDEPEGLIPNNYVEEATASQKAKALYDYTRQTDEELSFKEDALLDVYDTSDPDWTLVGYEGDFGFVPANYIDVKEELNQITPSLPTRPPAPAAPEPDSDNEQQPPTPDSPVNQSPAVALAGILQKKSEQQAAAPRSTISPPPNVTAPPRRVQFTPEESDEEVPPPNLPRRPESQQISPPITQYASPRSPESPPVISPRVRQVTFSDYGTDEPQPLTPLSGSGYHLYNIYEMVSHMGKNKKMPMTLGINILKGVIMISPEKARDGQQQEWTADRLEMYSQEGKHVFMELKRPSKSIDFHCGAKDTASEIVSALGELSGAAKASGLREVLAAGSGHSNVQKKGHMLFDFMAQGDDEVTVGLGDEVLVLDDSASDEWWKVRRLKNGKEGVVPSNYVEITETIPVANSSSRSGVNAGRSVVEQNRLEEQELTRQVARSQSRRQGDSGDGRAAGAGERGKRESKDGKSSSKPNPSKVRTWTDRTGSFKVEAEFIGLRDGKIHLHKVNGVKIAVPVPKMAIEDLEYVERITGVSLDDDKPLSDIKRRSTLRKQHEERSKAGISVEKKPEYDWFDFFLQCGVNPQICERYAQAFHKEQMGEEILPDVSEKLLRTLGLKEGDILRVMKFLDNKFGRTADKEKQNGDEASAGGLFSGPGGVLRNNTRKGRPAPPVQTSDIVDPKAFEQKSDDTVKKPVEPAPAPSVSTSPSEKKSVGFEDNAWEVKPSRQPAPAPAATVAPSPPATATAAPAPPVTSTAPAPSVPALTGSMGELSLLMPAIKPEVTPQSTPPQQPPAASQPPPPAPQPTGATPSLFDQVASLPPQPLAPPRQRPQAPQQQTQSSLIAPPPQRSSSAPQNPNQQSAFGPPPPLQPQLTGFNGAPNMHVPVAAPGQSLQDLLQQQRMAQQMQITGFQQQQTGFGYQQNGMMPQPTGFQSPAPMQPQQTGFGGFQPQPTGFQQPQQTGFQPQQTGFQPQPTGFQPQPTGFQPQPTGFQPQQTGFQPNQNQSPFANPPAAQFQPLQSQPTGFSSFSPQPLNPQATGVNRFLPPALQPTITSPLGASGLGSIPPVPPMPSMPAAQPLVPQKTGPPPPVRFGVQPAKKLTPQPTGRANLAKATPQNPFGF